MSADGPAATPGMVTIVRANGEPFAVNWPAWQPQERCVLTVIQEADQVLLIEKKLGFGAGKVSVPGGHIEAGETPLQAAVRETEEEVGLTPRNMRRAGTVCFAFTGGNALHVAVYAATAHHGALRSTPEATPFWCAAAAIPYSRMWSDDRIWLPLLLEQRYFDSWFIFEDDLSLWHQITAAPRSSHTL